MADFVNRKHSGRNTRFQICRIVVPIVCTHGDRSERQQLGDRQCRRRKIFQPFGKPDFEDWHKPSLPHSAHYFGSGQLECRWKYGKTHAQCKFLQSFLRFDFLWKNCKFLWFHFKNFTRFFDQVSSWYFVCKQTWKNGGKFKFNKTIWAVF